MAWECQGAAVEGGDGDVGLVRGWGWKGRWRGRHCCCISGRVLT